MFKNSVRKKYFKKLHKRNLLCSSSLYRPAAPKLVYKWTHPINLDFLKTTIIWLDCLQVGKEVKI